MSYNQLGITPIANPDLNSLYIISGEIDKGFNSSSTVYVSGNNSLIISGSDSYKSSLSIPLVDTGVTYVNLSGSINLENQWPKPNEFYKPDVLILAYNFKFDNSGDVIPVILSSGNTLSTSLNSILNSKTGDYINFTLLNTKYVFTSLDRYFTGSTYYVNGTIFKYDYSSEYNINYNTVKYLNPTLSNDGFSYRFDFIQSSGEEYSVQFRKNINDLWITTGISLYIFDQNGVPSGQIKKTFYAYQPSPETGYYYRATSFKFAPLSVGNFTIQSGSNVVNMQIIFNNSEKPNLNSYKIYSSGSNTYFYMNDITYG